MMIEEWEGKGTERMENGRREERRQSVSERAGEPS